MNRPDTLFIPKKPTYLPLALGLLVGGGSLTYAITYWSRHDHAAEQTSAVVERRSPDPVEDTGQAVGRRAEKGSVPAHGEGPAPETGPAPVADEMPAAADSRVKRLSSGPEGGHEGGPAPGAEKKVVHIKLEPLLANLDEGDQLRYIRLSLQLEVAGEAEQKAREMLPRARHEALMYLSGLHMSDVQGLLGKQRVHRELQRRIADALGGALKRVYIDEFVVQ